MSTDESLHKRLELEFVGAHRAKSAIDLVIRRLHELQDDACAEENGVPDSFEDDLQGVIDTLTIIGRALADIGGRIETVAIDFDTRVERAASEPPGLPPVPGPPRLVVSN